MRTKHLLLTLLLATLVPWSAKVQAQNVFYYGENATIRSADASPFGGYYNYEYKVFLYDAADVDFSGSVSALSFKLYDTVAANPNISFTWYMKDVPSGTTLSSSTTFDEFTNGLTPIIDCQGVPAMLSGWNTITLDNTFEHQSGNSILFMSRAVSSERYVGRSTCFIDNSQHVWYRTAFGYDPGTSIGASSIRERVPAVKFTYSPYVTLGDYWMDDFTAECNQSPYEGPWTFANDVYCGWAVGDGSGDVGNCALFISDDGGGSYQYDNGDATTVYAYKLFQFQQGRYVFDYNWRCVGVPNQAFLRIALVPSNQFDSFIAGSSPEGFSYNSLPAGWIPLDGSHQLVNNNSWQHEQERADFPATSCYYVVFIWCNDDDNSEYGLPAAIDDFRIARDFCPYDVTNLTVGETTQNSASLTWTGDVDAYEIGFSPTRFPYFDIVTSDDPAAVLGNLAYGTEYYAMVRASCDETNKGPWSEKVYFTTPCLDFSAPFTENFDSYTNVPSYGIIPQYLPTCWSLINNTTDNQNGTSNEYYPTMYGGNSHSSSNHLELSCCSIFYTGHTVDAQPQYAIMPLIENVNRTQLTLWARADNSINQSNVHYDATFKVGVMTDPEDATTFTEVATFTPTSTEYEQFTVPFGSYTGNGTYIAMMIEPYEAVQPVHYYYRSVFIDDVSLERVCPAPTDIAASNVTAVAADLSWNGSSLVDSYEVRYRTAEYSASLFEEDFENGMGDWTMRDCENNTGICAEASDNHSFRFYYNTTPPQYLISPELTGVTEGMLLKFYYKNQSTQYPETFQVGFSSTDNATASFTFGDEITVSDKQWHLYSQPIPAGTKYICWKYNSNDMYALYIDNIVVGKEVPAGEWQYVENIEAWSTTLDDLIPDTTYQAQVKSDCGSYGASGPYEYFTTLPPPPCDMVDNFALVAGSETHQGATFTWDDNGEDDFTVMVGPMTFTNHFVCMFDGETIPEVLTHNDGNYGFEKAVNDGRNCAKSSNGGHQSSTAEMILTVTLPMEGQLSFDARISSEKNYDKAFFSIDGVVQDSLNGISGQDTCWFAYSNTIPAGTHTLRWYYTKDNSLNKFDDCFYVGDIIINSYVVDNWTSFEHATSPFTVTGLNTETHYFAKAIRNCGTYVHSNDSYVDAFWTLPCLPPTGLEVLDLTSEYVSFHFDVEEGVTYQYCIVQAGNGPSEVLFNGNTSVAPTYIGYGLLGFHPDTDYVIYARKKCSDDEVSQPDSIIFHTLHECASIPTAALPRTEDFEDVQASGDDSTENILPECWDYINTSTDSYNIFPLVYNAPNLAHQGDNSLYFLSVFGNNDLDPQDQYAILPPMEDVNQLKLSFYAANLLGYNGYTTTFSVGVMEGMDASTFTAIQTFTSTSAAYELYTVSFESYTGNGNRIAIKMDPANADYIYAVLNIDDITVSQHYVVVDADHDFTDNFEYGLKWELVNGDLTNAWAWGEAAHNGYGNRGLYISNDGGTTNAYNNTLNTMVYAYKNFWLEAGIYEFSYDWLANGENIYDYLRVALVSADVDLEAATEVPYGLSYNALPDGWIALDGGTKLNLVTEWQTASHEIVVPEAGIYKMVFAWRNDYSYGANPPAAIDNVSITVPCAIPVNLAATSVRATSADIIWTGGPDTENYTVNYRQSGIVFNEGFENGIGDWTLRNCHLSTSVYNDCGHSGDYGFCFYYSSNPPQYLISPELIGVIEGMNLEFYYKNDDQEYPETFQIGFSATDNEAVSFTFGETITASDMQWHLYSEPIPAGTKYICWKLTSDDQYFLYLDDIVVGAENLAGEWQTATVFGGSLQMATVLTGLSPETPYEFYIYPNCNPDNVSETAYFTTIEICAKPFYLLETEIRATSVDLSWMDNPEVDSYTVNYRVQPYFSQGFEDGTMPDGWTQSGLGTWNVTQGYGYNSIGTHHGNYNVRINHRDREDETFLISPVLDLSGLNAPNLSFWYINYNWGGDDTDQLYVYYRVNGGDWIELWNTTEDHPVWTSSGDIALPNPSANYQLGFKMIDKYGHGLGIDDIVIGKAGIVYDWQTVTVAGGTLLVSTTLTGLTPETIYEAYVYPDCDPFKPSETITFTTLEQTTIAQTIALAAGVNWVSFNVETTLDSLKAALVAAMPVSGVTIAAKDDGQTFYNGTRWRGALASLDMAQMYRITVPSACEIVLEGMPVDPSSHPITIKSGLNWIGYPFMESMTITDAFAGFAVSGDEVRAKDDGIAKYVGTRWRGALTHLVPGQGYIYNSAVSGNRTFVYPTGSSKSGK